MRADAPLDPEQVAEIRDELGQHSGWSKPMATAGYPVGRVRALCDTVEHLRKRVERYEEALEKVAELAVQNRFAARTHAVARDALQAIEEAQDE